MSVSKKFPEYVILVNPTTLQPYVASGGGGGVSSSVSLLDDVGGAINLANPLPVRVTTLPSVVVSSLPALPAGANTIGKVDQGTGGVSAWKVDGSAVTQPVSGTVGVSGTVTVAGAVTVTGTVAISGTPTVSVSNTVAISGTVTANAGTGTMAVAQTNLATADYDTGAGTVTQSMVGIALPASGGPVAGGTATNPLVVSVGNTVTVTGTVAVSGTAAVTQSGTWNVGLSAGSNTVGKVDQGVAGASAWKVDGSAVTQPVSGSVTVSGTVTANAGTGTFTVAQTNMATADYDSGAGTVTQTMIGLCVPASGGPVALPGDGTNGLKVQITGGSVSATQSGTWTVQQGSPPWPVSQSGAWSVSVTGTVTVDTELPAAALLTDARTNPTTVVVGSMPHIFNGTSWDMWRDITQANGVSGAATSVGIPGVGLVVFDTVNAQYRRTNSAASGVAGGLDGTRVLANGPMGYDGAAFYNLRLDSAKNLQVNVNAALPTGSNVIGAVTQSGTWTVQQGSPPWSVSGGLTHNNAAPGSNNVGVLAAVANAAAPVYGEGQQVLLSVDLAGNLRVSGGASSASSTQTIQQIGQDQAAAVYDRKGWRLLENILLAVKTPAKGTVDQGTPGNRPWPVAASVGRIYCDDRVYRVYNSPINATASGDNTILRGPTGFKIRIVSITFTCSATVDIAFKSSTTNTIINAMSFGKQGGLGMNFVPGGFFMETNAGEAFLMNLSAAANVRGSFNYILV